MINNMSSKKIKTLAVLWIGCFALLAAFYYLFLVPQQKSLDTLRAKINAEEEKRADLRLAGMPSVQKEYRKKIENLQKRLNEMVSGYDDSSSMTFAVSKIAREKNISSFTSKGVKRVLDPTLEKCKNISEKRIRVSVNSDFAGFIQYLNSLERNQPVIFVDKFSLEKNSKKSTLDVEMELAAFTRKKTIMENPVVN